MAGPGLSMNYFAMGGMYPEKIVGFLIFLDKFFSDHRARNVLSCEIKFKIREARLSKT